MPKYEINIEWNQPTEVINPADLAQEIAWAIQQRFDEHGDDVASVSVQLDKEDN